MNNLNNDFNGLWRASANEGVPYSEDFPEALLVLPEFIDGALGAGQASIIDIKFNITNPNKCELIINDNGKGLISEKRMKAWSSKDIGDNKKENIYGHGSKKALTKFAPDYASAEWQLFWRKQDSRGVSGVLNILCSPFNGLDTKHIEDEINDDICPGHGTCWKVIFDIAILGNINTAQSIMNTMQEIIRIRYEPSYFQPYNINIQVTNGLDVFQKSSSEWKSLKECLEDAIETGDVIKKHDDTFTLDKSTANYCFYEIVGDGRQFNIPGLSKFGKKNMEASRVHLSRNGRYIEAMPYSKFISKKDHNSANGKIGFIIFTGEELPTPCTTKVKLQEDCPILKKMKDEIIVRIKQKSSVPPPPPPPPQPHSHEIEEKDLKILKKLCQKYNSKLLLDAIFKEKIN